MVHDQIFTFSDDLGVELKIIPVALNFDKEIFFSEHTFFHFSFWMMEILILMYFFFSRSCLFIIQLHSDN